MKKTASGVELEVGKTYRLGSYKSRRMRDAMVCGDCNRVAITAIKPDEKIWYDDHQEGGHMSRGVVEFVFCDDTAAASLDGDGWEYCEYAEEHWWRVFWESCEYAEEHWWEDVRD